MKKISSVAEKQNRSFSEQKLTIGFDLGDRSSWYCVLDATGSVLLEQRLSTTPKAMKEVLGAMPRSRIALETGMHSPWVSRLLSELGHEVIVAHARNVRLIGESRKKDDEMPDLIILDIGLPGCDGYSVMRCLNAFPELADVPVIVLTGRDGFTHERRCREAGAKRFFEKPVTNLHLMTAIQQLLG